MGVEAVGRVFVVQTYARYPVAVAFSVFVFVGTGRDLDAVVEAVVKGFGFVVQCDFTATETGHASHGLGVVVAVERVLFAGQIVHRGTEPAGTDGAEIASQTDIGVVRTPAVVVEGDE